MTYLKGTDVINDTRKSDVSSYDDGGIIDRLQKDGHFFTLHNCIYETRIKTLQYSRLQNLVHGFPSLAFASSTFIYYMS